MDFPVEYMFKEVPADVDPDADPVSVVLGEMDHFGIEKAMVGVSLDRTVSTRALTEHPDRSFGSYEVNPNLRMEVVRNLVRAHAEHGVYAATAFPPGTQPHVPPNDQRHYPPSANSPPLHPPIHPTTTVPRPRAPTPSPTPTHP